MSVSSFAVAAVSLAWATLTYLVSYRLVLILAPAASVLAQVVFRPSRILPARGAYCLRALVVGAATPPAASAVGHVLTLAAARRAAPLAIVALLGGAHFFTAYCFLLIGPLLGKDVLLSHLIGASFYLTIVATTWRSAAGPGRNGVSGGDETPARLVLLELARIGPHVVLGLALAGVVAAWGLSPAHVELAVLLGGGIVAQAGSAVVGTGLAVTSCLPPVANLFVATYLWKTGLAHAGLVSFVLASAATLARRRLYRATLGDEAGRKLWWAFLIAAPLAGIGTAVVFHLLGLTIHYRLSGEQLL